MPLSRLFRGFQALIPIWEKYLSLCHPFPYPMKSRHCDAYGIPSHLGWTMAVAHSDHPTAAIPPVGRSDPQAAMLCNCRPANSPNPAAGSGPSRTETSAHSCAAEAFCTSDSGIPCRRCLLVWVCPRWPHATLQMLTFWSSPRVSNHFLRHSCPQPWR